MGGWHTRRALIGYAVAAAAAGVASPVCAQAQRVADDVAARLTPEQLEAYNAYLTARTSFDRQLEMYWALIEERRDHRRRKRAKAQPVEPNDYVQTQPPKYAGPPLPPEVAKVIAELRPPEPEKLQPVVADYITAAQTHFGFAPTLTTERDFKRRYAIEALNAGLNKMQVVRVYALETGGNGTYDMQAGFDPLTRQGKPISSALGYAQLLAANSTSELVKHGDEFIRRLEAMAAQPNMQAQHVQHWQWKAGVLRRMLAAARSIPNEWSQHRKFAITGPGLGIHTLNMDADVGPWLQALKLKGILQIAADAGRAQLTGGELEMMNLAGPRSGLELMEPIGRTMPTANLFEQGGYYRNTIVREKTGAELLKALDDRMDISIKRPGAVEFLAVFDEVINAIRPATERATQAASQPTLLGTFDTAR
jgi:hypothetical protein